MLPVTTPSANDKTNQLIHLCETYQKDYYFKPNDHHAVAQAVINVCRGLLDVGYYSDTQKLFFVSAVSMGLRRYLENVQSQKFLMLLKEIPIDLLIPLELLNKIFNTLKQCGTDIHKLESCLFQFIHAIPPIHSIENEKSQQNPLLAGLPSEIGSDMNNRWLKPRDAASLACTSRFFAQTHALALNKEDIPRWPGDVITDVVHNDITTFIFTGFEVFAFGSNTSNQLGLEDIRPVNIPTYISLPANKRIVSIIINYASTFLLSESGQWYACGNNLYAQLGLGHKEPVTVPTEVFLPTHEKITDVVTNNGSTFLRSESGQWYACGNNMYSQLGLGHESDVNVPTEVFLPTHEKIIAVVTDNGSTFMLSVSGQWFACGNNQHRQLGLGFGSSVTSLILVSLPINEKIASIITGNDSTFLRSESGQWYACGNNRRGQLGLGHANKVNAPTEVILLANEKITAVVTNDGSTFLRSESGQWYA